MKLSELITLAEREAQRLEAENDHSAAILMRQLIEFARATALALKA